MSRSQRLILIALVPAGVMWWAVFSDRDGRTGADTGEAPEQEASASAVTAVRGDARSAPEIGSAEVGRAQNALGPDGEPLEALDCNAPEGDVARVDGQAISAAEFCSAWRRLSGPVSQGSPLVMDLQGKQLLERMIDAMLVARALAADGLSVSEADVDAALNAAIARRAQPIGADKPASGSALFVAKKAFEAELKTQGSTLEQVRTELRDRLALEALVAHREPFEPSEAALRHAYAEDPTRFGTPRTARVEGYLARAPQSAPAHERQHAREVATAFSTRVAGGESAEAAAGPGLQRMAPFEVTTADAEPQLAAAAFRLAPSGWSAPVQTRAGFVVLQLQEIRDGEPRSFSEVREQVKQRLQSEHVVAARQRIRAALRDATTIEYLRW